MKKGLLAMQMWAMWLMFALPKLLMHSVLSGGIQRPGLWTGLQVPVGSLRRQRPQQRRPRQRLQVSSECSTSKNPSVH